MNIYVHVPFCARKCSYCDFAIAVRRQVPSTRYVDLVLAEWQSRQGEAAWADSPLVDTIYLGGGTPSHLDTVELARLLRGLCSTRPVAPGAEVTLEANPDDITPEKALSWRAAGINRVSLGVQSFDDRALQWMHRAHDAAAAASAVQVLRDAGFDNISLDLIFALPAMLERDWRRDLDQALALRPEHLSLYGLTVEAHTPLGRWTERGEVRPASDERYAEEYLVAHEALAAAGYHHYEVSNAAQPGREAVHNRGYWRQVPFMGLGPSAHSGAHGARWWNVREWASYEETSARGASLVAERESLDEQQLRIERAYLGLRTSDGLPLDLAGARASRWVDAGWARIAGDRVVLTAEGWLRLDALVASLA